MTRDSFVKVGTDSSHGKNRPDGYGYITACHGVGGAAIYDVKYTPVYDGGRTHRKISLDFLTPCTPFNDIITNKTKRKRKQTQSSVISTLLQPSDNRLLIDKLKDALILGSRRGKKKGWHRRTLVLQTGRQFNDKEMQQFQIELLLLEKSLSTSNMLRSL